MVNNIFSHKYIYTMNDVEEMGPQVVVSDELRYRKKELAHPKYKLSRLFPITGRNGESIGSGGGNQIEFQLPVRVFNLAESVLEFTITPPALAAPLVGHYVAYKTPLSAIQQIELITQSGTKICDVMHLNKYMNVVYYPETPLSDFLTNEITKPTILGAKSIGTHRSNSLPTTNAARLINISSSGQYVVAGASPAASIVDSTIAYTERSYYQVASAELAAEPIIKVSFPMKHIYNTIFALDKDIYFGEILTLRVILADPNQVYYVVNEATLVAANNVDIKPTDPTIAGEALMLDVPGSISVSDIYFYLALETELAITQQIMNEYTLRGITLPISYVYTNKTTINGGSNQNISIRLNSAHGKKLRKIYHAPSHPKEKHIYNYNRYNVNSQLLTSYYTMLNNDRLQEFNITMFDYKDWQLIKNKLTGSAIQSVEEYRGNYFIVDDFTSEKSLWSEESQNPMLSSGIPLSAEQKWDLFITVINDRSAVGGYLHYTFIITEKELVIRPGMITVA